MRGTDVISRRRPERSTGVWTDALERRANGATLDDLAAHLGLSDRSAARKRLRRDLDDYLADTVTRLRTTVMVASDEVAFGVFDGLKTAGIDIPGDMLLTGFDGLPQASWAGYDLTTVVQATDVLVEKTIELLLGQRDGAESGHIADVVVPGTIRFGRTTRRPHG